MKNTHIISCLIGALMAAAIADIRAQKSQQADDHIIENPDNLPDLEFNELVSIALEDIPRTIGSEQVIIGIDQVDLPWQFERGGDFKYYYGAQVRVGQTTNAVQGYILAYINVSNSWKRIALANWGGNCHNQQSGGE